MGGDRDVLPAGARAARRRRAADAVDDAGAVRPARGARRARALPRVSRVHPRRVAPRATSRARTATPARSRRSSTPPRSTSAPASGCKGSTCSPRSAATSRGPRRRRTRSCRCWPRTPACGCNCAPASTPTAAASATAGAAGCGCRSARTRRGWTGCSRRPACARRASTSPTCSTRRAPAPAAHRRRPAARADRPRDDRARLEPRRLSGRRRLPQLPPLHAAPPPRVGQRRRAVRPERAPPAAARRDAADFVARTRERVAGGGLAVCALDTELLGDWWHEGPLWLAAVIDEAARQGLALDAPRRRARAPRAGPAPAGPAGDVVGDAARPVDVERAAGRRHGVERARRRAAHRRRGCRGRRARRARAARAAVQRLGVSRRARPRRALRARARRRRTARSSTRRSRRPATLDPRLHNLAPRRVARGAARAVNAPGHIADSQTFFPHLADISAARSAARCVLCALLHIRAESRALCAAGSGGPTETGGIRPRGESPPPSGAGVPV